MTQFFYLSFTIFIALQVILVITNKDAPILIKFTKSIYNISISIASIPVFAGLTALFAYLGTLDLATPLIITTGVYCLAIGLAGLAWLIDDIHKNLYAYKAESQGVHFMSALILLLAYIGVSYFIAYPLANLTISFFNFLGVL